MKLTDFVSRHRPDAQDNLAGGGDHAGRAQRGGARVDLEHGDAVPHRGVHHPHKEEAGAGLGPHPGAGGRAASPQPGPRPLLSPPRGRQLHAGGQAGRRQQPRSGRPLVQSPLSRREV